MARPRLHPAADEDRARLGRTLRECREASGLTVTQVVGHLGISDGYVRNIESGRKRIPPGLLLSFAGLYGVPVAQITGEEVAA